MGKANFSDDFKRDAVRQITERGYPVSEVSQLPPQKSSFLKHSIFGEQSTRDRRHRNVRRALLPAARS